MATKRDYYEVLGVDRGASNKEIKQSYRKIAMKNHPDRCPNDQVAATRFKEASEAYTVLSDAEKKQAYDQFGHAGIDPNMYAQADFTKGFSDIFGNVFGGGVFGGGFGDLFGQSQRGNDGADLQYELTITLEQAANGGNVEITVPMTVDCDSCKGSGLDSRYEAETCPQCNGVGVIRMQQNFFSIQQTCSHCGGNGKIITHPCSSCNGAGQRRQNRTLSLKIQQGVDDGMRIRLANQGEAGHRGGRRGDLYILISVKKHPIFVRKNNDIYCTVQVDLVTAILGDKKEIPTLTGSAIAKIPPGSQSGDILRLRKKGIKSVQGHEIGDMLCRIEIEAPINLSSKQKKLLRQFYDSLDKSNLRPSPHK